MSGAEKDAPEKSVQDFLQRWSRRKLGGTEAEDTAAPAEPSQSGEPQLAPPPETAPEVPVAFDLTKLPPIESIDATTDIRAFLAPGVPAELTRAALRRAWTSDPAIRDFVGLAENQWDFTNPDAVPGFGSLDLKEEEVRAMVSRLFGETPAEPAKERDEKSQTVPESGEPAVLDAAVPDSGKPSASTAAIPADARGSDAGDYAALQKDSRAERPEPAQRQHGSALPK
jgi:hypothetical protein